MGGFTFLLLLKQSQIFVEFYDDNVDNYED